MPQNPICVKQIRGKIYVKNVKIRNGIFDRVIDKKLCFEIIVCVKINRRKI